jgi:hypothetical protein
VADYLARAANARVVYKHLFDSAVLTLPLMLTEGDNVECYYTLTDIADALPWTKSQIANELRLLSNFGWLQTRKGSWRYLGRRDENGAFLLLADMAAFHTTGVERLISNRILEITLPAPEPTIENTKRGAAREWSGTQTQGGGELDLGT